MNNRQPADGYYLAVAACGTVLIIGPAEAAARPRRQLSLSVKHLARASGAINAEACFNLRGEKMSTGKSKWSAGCFVTWTIEKCN